MELFPATDQQQLDFIKRVIDRCDYYVVIVGGRYGSLADDNLSFTEKEYEYAVSKRIPVLAFLHAHPEAIPVGKTDHSGDKLHAFQERLKTSRIVDFWNDAQDLCTQVVIAVGQSVNLTPGIGWIRGDQALDPRLLQDLENLRTENEKLKQELKELSPTEITFPADLPSPEEAVELTYYEGMARKPSARSKGETFKTTWKDIFLAASEGILGEQPEPYVADRALKVTGRGFGLSAEDIPKVRLQLEALGLIRAISKTSSIEGRPYSFIAWSITDKGRRYLAQQRAVKR
jgi:hypothetical protein